VKTQFLLIFFLLLATVLPSFAGPKIATVAIDDIMAKYHLSQKDIAEFKAAKAKLEENPRRKAVTQLENNILENNEKLRTMDPTDEEQPTLFAKGRELQSSLQELLIEWNKYQAGEMRTITEDFINSVNLRNSEIQEVIRQISEAEGIDWVIETSGTTSSQVPVVLYIRESTDVTDKVIKILNKDSPEAVAPEDAKTPANGE